VTPHGVGTEVPPSSPPSLLSSLPAGIARQTGDVRAEMAALHALGLSAEALSEHEQASAYHEAHRAAAEGVASSSSSSSTSPAAAAEGAAQVVLASSGLVRVYTTRAGHAEAQRDLGESLRLHLLALTAARQSGDEEWEGRTNHAVGRAYVMAGKAAEGVPYLKTYLSIATKNAQGSSVAGAGAGAGAGVATGSGAVAQAYAALAAAYQALGEGAASSACLQELLDVATASGDEAAQADAAENIGILHACGGRRDEAEPFLQTAFTLRRKLVAEGRLARSLLDSSRIYLGMVKGDARAAPLFAHVAKVDIVGLLNWRVQRRELAVAATATAAAAAEGPAAAAAEAAPAVVEEGPGAGVVVAEAAAEGAAVVVG
jgi:tetratricopeptide (TPR) repeat protein